MGDFQLGGLVAVPGSARPDLLAEPTRQALAALGLLDLVGVVEIDPEVSDTATTQQVFGLAQDTLANCVVVGGKREGAERLAACVVLATTRADVNGTVRHHLDVRKASFLPVERAVEMTGMEYGGITPIGLPGSWPVLVDRAVTGDRPVVIGSGVRRSKILLPGRLLGELPGAVVLDGLGVPLAPSVAIRPVETGDLDTIFEQMRDPESVRMAAFTQPDPNDRDAFDAHMAKVLSSPEVKRRAIVSGSRLVGTIASYVSDGATEVTYWVDRACWGQGIATRALHLLLEEVSARPVRARAASDNAGSLRVLEKAGFRVIGTEVSFAPARAAEIEETILELP